MAARVNSRNDMQVLLGHGNHIAGSVGFVDPSGRSWIVMNDTAGAVNALQVQNNVAGSAVILTVGGNSPDTNAGMTIQALTTGTLTLGGASNTTSILGSLSMGTVGTASVTIGSASALLSFGVAALAPTGGGATAALGTVGGSGPATAAQNGWLKVQVQGTNSFIPYYR